MATLNLAVFIFQFSFLIQSLVVVFCWQHELVVIKLFVNDQIKFPATIKILSLLLLVSSYCVMNDWGHETCFLICSHSYIRHSVGVDPSFNLFCQLLCFVQKINCSVLPSMSNYFCSTLQKFIWRKVHKIKQECRLFNYWFNSSH